MSMELINKIEAKISELEAQAKKNSDFIASASTSMDKLMSEKTNATNEWIGINGAIQMGRGVIAELKAMLSPSSPEVTLDVQPVE